jgi:hypothetical protein
MRQRPWAKNNIITILAVMDLPLAPTQATGANIPEKVARSLDGGMVLR